MTVPAPSQIIADTRAARSRRRSPLRTILFVIVILIVLGGIAYVVVRNGFTQPLSITPYPNATVVAHTTATGADHTVYVTNDDIPTVGHYYQLLIGQSDTSTCQQAGDLQIAHCIIDQDTLGNEQTVRITIGANPGSAKQTQIVVDRTWPQG